MTTALLTFNSTTDNTAASLLRSLKSDLLSVATLRSNRVLVAAMGLVGGGAAALMTSYADANIEDFDVAAAPGTGVQIAVLAALVFGVLAHTSESSHGTLMAKLVAQPSRRVYLLSRGAVVVTMGLVLALMATLGGVVGTLAAGADVAAVSSGLGDLVWNLPGAALAALIGFAIGILVRHSAFAVAAVVIWWLIVEPMVGVAVADDIHLLPFGSLSAIGFVENATIAALGWTAAIAVPAAAFFGRRDLG